MIGALVGEDVMLDYYKGALRDPEQPAYLTTEARYGHA